MTSPRTLLKAFGIRPRKSMGQHFLTDPNVAAMIVRRAGLDHDDTVLEIGAGLGALTIPLARQVKQVLAVESDHSICTFLKGELLRAGISNVTILEKDILKCDIESMAGKSGAPLKVVGNLPYNISSRVLMYLINSRRCVDGAVLMFQKEVAERILAKPGTKTYGRLSVLIQYCARIYPVARVAASAFFPKPKVDSQVVGVDFYDPLPFPAEDEPFLFRLTQVSFGKRRKTLKNALLSSALGFDKSRISLALKDANIDPQRRPETLGVEEFVRLASAMKKSTGISA